MPLDISDPGCEISRARGNQVKKQYLPNTKPPLKMTREQFKQWLDKVDLNGDGYISWNELYAALQVFDLKYKHWKVWRAMNKIDLNRNNHIDLGKEREMLVDFAEKNWGIIQG